VRKSCPSCKIELDPQYLFCPECGSTLDTVDEARPASPPSSFELAPPTAEAAPGSQMSPRPGSPPSQTRMGQPSVAPAGRRFRIVRLARGGGAAVPHDIPESGLTLGRDRADLSFPDDDTVSPRHALLKPAGDALVVEDLGSLNGLFLRIQEPHTLAEGDWFVCGDSVFRVSLVPGTFPAAEFRLYTAPAEKAVMATLTRLLADGRDGEVYPVRTPPFVIGREEGDVRLGADRFLSRRHAAIQPGPDGLALVDQKSRNGTYVRCRGPLRLHAGDILLIGRQLLRVEAVA
jgi:pSer/pThr/pTyr-binding forkhead associated (FHA) protein